MRVTETSPTLGATQMELARKCSVCESALTEARRLVDGRVFGSLLARLVARIGDLLDEIDEALIGLQPGPATELVARIAALHRELADLLAALPDEFQALPRHE